MSASPQQEFKSSGKGGDNGGDHGKSLLAQDGIAKDTIIKNIVLDSRPMRRVFAGSSKMAARPQFRIYLAGPISDCNDDQKRRWREDVKAKYSNKLEFIDPLDNLLPDTAHASDLVRADVEAIQSADGLLVNMWRESIGSAIGVVHAHREGRPVVIANPNHIRNRMLEFYADAITDAPLKAAKALFDILRAENDWEVMKSADRDEPFRRVKLLEAIRITCRKVNCDDILIPSMALPMVIEGLKGNNRKVKQRIPSRIIRDEVRTALEELAASIPAAVPVAEEWLYNYDTGQGAQSWVKEPLARGIDSEVSVEIRSSKSHATIWGASIRELDDIPSRPAREIFRAIRSVPGITRIVLGSFGHKESRNRCCARVVPSKTNFVIEGTLFDEGKKGKMQNFQVKVQREQSKQEISEAIETSLKKRNLWADQETVPKKE